MKGVKWTDMESKQSTRKYRILSMVFFILLGTTCQKNPENDPALPERVISARFYLGGKLATNIEYHYSDNLLTEIIKFNDAGDEIFKTVYQYNGNKIKNCTSYTQTNGSWETASITEIKGYSGDDPVEIIAHQYDLGVEQGQIKTLYTYEGGLLKKKEKYNSWNSTWQQVENIWFKYDGRGRIWQETDSSNIVHTKTYYYAGDLMVEAISEVFDGEEQIMTIKTTYVYLNDRLSAALDSVCTSSTWMKAGKTQYDYNEHGELWRLQYEGSGCFGPEMTEYTYGKGTGNYRQCAKIDRELVLPGDPTPSPVIASSPQILRKNPLQD